MLHYSVNNRSLSSISELNHEFSYDINKNYLFNLSYLTSIQVAGDKAREFLQGQLTCDMRDVHAHEMRQGALCNLKGRILALLDVILWNEPNFQLILPKDLLSETTHSLEKTAVFSRVALHHDDQYECLGFYLQNLSDILPFDRPLPDKKNGITYGENWCCYDLGNHFFILLINKKILESTTKPFIQKGQWRGSLAWHQLQLLEKFISIYPLTRGLFLPHRVDLHLSGYLNFNKGCYKGQEIIARTHYRAKLKHTLKLFTIETKEPIQSGQKLLGEQTHAEMGELIDYCPLGDHRFLIVASVLFDHPVHALIEEHEQSVLLEPWSTTRQHTL